LKHSIVMLSTNTYILNKDALSVTTLEIVVSIDVSEKQYVPISRQKEA
jgi:hypothetical protein